MVCKNSNGIWTGEVTIEYVSTVSALFEPQDSIFQKGLLVGFNSNLAAICQIFAKF